ncbi:hypothetical protein PFFVO_06030 [Plasmodium falciparum Vietnam Oak-Knoll (FVO)]|uniref:Surface antigen n=1 Tax=Plasmodium falciparum Vietnam Oak-Knoll (FVO) TaxID=1036723 RepID=A0A024UWQ6_PLAFA|nr:hypothetical protein PFFVO_06030 [Plasmodium falciparum Vietnam Oak-Knoll (FVO)]
MKFHYFNIFLFSLTLNILLLSPQVYNQRNHYITPLHIPSARLLCECEFYGPSNYYNDPEMKTVIQDFDRQTSQRFEEYNERMNKNRQKCKDKCDKEIQKIILKDKLEKELMYKFATLQTDVQSDAIPTCVCEKSLADKTEKFCLNCSKNMGAIAPWWGLVCGVGYAGWTNYVATTIAKMATDAGIEAGVKVGLAKVTEIVTKLLTDSAHKVPPIHELAKMTTGISAEDVTLSGIFKMIDTTMSAPFEEDLYAEFSVWVQKIAGNPKYYIGMHPEEAAEVTKAFAEAKTAILTKTSNATSSLTTGITASLIAIVVIVLIMIIIYLVLRYRRKKKMKKKLQYIKLLEE